MADKLSQNLASAKTEDSSSVTSKITNKKSLSQSNNGKIKSPRVRKRKRRFDPTEKLPTPPPDPHEMEKSSGERSPKRKSLEENKENSNIQLDNIQRAISQASVADVSSPSALEFATAFSGTEEAFQHLDKLHSLMEQIIELRAKNARLFRRVRELERVKALKKLEASTRKTFLQGDIDPHFPDEDVGFAESLLCAMLESSSNTNQSTPVPASPNQEVNRVRSFRAPITRQRSRSIGTESLSLISPITTKRSSCHLQYNAIPLSKSSKRNSLATIITSPKVSKWTKVKAAFKWEKAGMGTGIANSSFSNVVAEALEHDAVKFLRLPEFSDAMAMTTTVTPSGSSPRTIDYSSPPSPGTISSSSSLDDVYSGLNKRSHMSRPTTRETEEELTRRSRSSDGELIIPQNIQCAVQHSKDTVCRRLEKGHKTPWGMMKDIIQSRRESVRRPLPFRGSLRSEDGYSLSSLESSDMLHEILTSDHLIKPRVQITTSECSLPLSSPKPLSPTNSSEIVDLASRRLTPTLTITVPSSEELRRVSSPESVSPPTSQHQLDSNSTDERSPSEDPENSSSSPKRQNPAVINLRERRKSASATVIAVQQQALSRLQRQDSKWNKVKRAFLSGASSVPPSPSRISSFFDETDAGGSYSASAEDLDNNGGVSPTTQIDIQRNYQLLHDKLSVEFNRKLSEWEKLKNGGQTSPEIRITTSTSRSTVTSSPKDKDSANALLMGEEQLTPEFKKKLQEWKRMKKSGGSTSPNVPEHQLFRRRLTDWQIWPRTQPTTAKSNDGKPSDDSGKSHLSEDFLKKMEEWKKIKSGRSDEEQSTVGDRRDSGEMIFQTRNFNRRWKTLDEKEFQPLDKVIAMIEREQQALEKYREKLLDKKLRQNKLNHSAGGMPAKREVLVHTSTGFYRFEGISQEFKQKLYEWEKSQGIAPESSTLQLLNPTYRASATDKNIETTHEKGSRSLKRSKSMSSVVESSLRDSTSIRQPSSLSLNDVTNLENEAKLRIDSKQTIGEEEMSEELAILDDSEPEAVIVDIEDVIEETASPLAKLQPQQTPVYCVTASETTSIAIPLGTVTASHEPSPVILIQAGESHHGVRQHNRFSENGEDIQVESSSAIYLDNKQSTSQIDTFETSETQNEEGRKRLYDSSDIKICETIIEEDIPSTHIGEESNSDAEVSNVVKVTDNAEVGSSEEINLHENKTLDLIGVVNEVEESIGKQSKKNITKSSTSTSDSTKKIFKTLVTPSNKILNENVEENSQKTDNLRNNDSSVENSGPQEVQKNEEIDNSVITVSSDIRQKKVLKTRRLTDTQVGYKWRQSSQTIEETSPEPADALTVSTFPETPTVEKIIINESTLNKIVVPTASNEQISNIAGSDDAKKSDDLTEETYCRRLTNKSESKSVFVKTKRIIFSPFSRRNSKDKSALSTLQKDDTLQKNETAEIKKESTEQKPVASPKSIANPPISLVQKFSQNIQRSRSSGECPSTCEKRPPLPQSPILSRKEYRRSSPKETAPSIRMMIQRYNQKLQEDAGSPASSGSGSPIWRSPTSERRVRTQMERYQEEVRKAIAGSSRNSDNQRLEKSASASVIQSESTSVGMKNIKGEILKSTSADFVRNPDFVKQDSTSEIKKKLEDGKNNSNQCYPEKRKNSLQNKNPEIFSNIKQSLVQEYKTLPIRSGSVEEKSQNSSQSSDKTLSSSQDSKGTLTADENKIPGKISPELIHKLNALSNAATQKHGRYNKNNENQVTASENSTPLRVRAQRIKKAKDDFFSRGPGCHSHDPSIESYRHSQSSAASIELGTDFVKSASAGMINIDSRTFERLAPVARGTESLPRPEKSYVEVSGTLSKIASKFRRAKLKRSKDKEKDGKMSTISMLCRQSLLVDIQSEEMSKSCPTSPSPQRDEDEHLRFKQHRDSN